jgi:RHS repeat-associated protein
MNEQEYLELGRVIIDYPLDIQAVKELCVEEAANEHGRLSLRVVSRQLVSEQDALRLSDAPIRILTDEGGPVFAGVTTSLQVHRWNQYNEVTLEAASASIKTDMENRSRTFQDPGKMLSQVFQEVLAPYGVDLQLQRDMQVSQMLSQQNETDWCFVRRIANQFGMIIFTDSKAPSIRISIGVVPFSRKFLPANADLSWVEKDIANYWKVKQNFASQASAYEFLKKGFHVAELTLGAGHVAAASGRVLVVTQSKITAMQGLLSNRILLTCIDGAYPPVSTLSNIPPAPEHEHVTDQPPAAPMQPSNRPAGPSVVAGEVLDVSGNDIQVLFHVDGPGAGVRWIPYCSFLNNDFYCMPDIGDTVFCYYENEGSVACLGSRHVHTKRTDFANPAEKVLTANNRMIKLKRAGIDLSANRRNTDGLESDEVKIILSDKTGIEISAAREITIRADKNMVLQANDLEAVQEQPLAWFEAGRKARMTQFDSEQTAGEERYVADGGNQSYNAGWDLIQTLSGNLIGGFVNEVAAPFQLIGTLGDLFAPPADPPGPAPLRFDSINEYQILLTGLQVCELALENGPSILFTEEGIQIDAPKFRWFGFTRDAHPQVSESQQTFMDFIMDAVQLVVDIVGCIPGCNVICGAINAGVSLLRGDYYGALSGVVGMCCPGGGLITRGVGMACKACKTLKKVVTVLRILKAGAIALNAMIQGGRQIYDLTTLMLSGQFKFSNPDHLSMFTSIAQSFFAAGTSIKNACDSYKDLRAMNSPDGKTNRPQGGEDAADAPKQKGESNEPSLPLGDTADPKNVNSCGDPIDAVTGSQKLVYTDLLIRDIGGTFPLVRAYESLHSNEHGLLGSRWFLNVGSWIKAQDQEASIMMPDMHIERFVRQDGRWTSRRGGDRSLLLEQSEAGFTLKLIKEGKTYRYDPQGRLTAIMDRNGNCTWLRYVNHTLTRMEFTSGQVLHFTYAAGKLTGIQDAIGRAVLYRYDRDLLTEVEYPNGGVIHYRYTAEGYIADITDQNGHHYLHDEYDSEGRVTRQLLSSGQEYILLYDDGSRRNTFLDPLTGRRTIYHYNQDKLTTKIEYSDGSYEAFAYDERENKTYIRDRRGHELHRVYNEKSLLEEERLPNGLITWFAYDENDRLIHQWDNAGQDQTFRYNAGGEPVEISTAIDDSHRRILRFEYDALGRMTALITPNGGRLLYTYEGNWSEPVSFRTAEGAVFRYAYDGAGRRMSILSDQGETQFAYNSLDYRTQITDALGNITKYTFDMLCNLTKIVRPNQYNPQLGDGEGTRFVYDEMDEQVQRIDPLGNVFATLRDAAENVVKEISPNAYDPETGGEGIRNEYDADDRKIRILYPDGGIERIFYDPAGNIVKKVQPMDYDPATDDGPGYTYEYDAVNRLVQITAPNGTVEKRYVYDLRGNIVKQIDAAGYRSGDSDETRVGALYRYNQAGWLLEKREPVQKTESGALRYCLTEYRYDASGNLAEERRYQDFQTEKSAAGPVLCIFFTYDKDDRLVRVSDSTGAAVEYAYDSLNRRTKEKRRLSDGLYQVFHWKYDAAGRMVEHSRSIDREDGGWGFAATTYSYDKSGNLTRIQTPTGGEILREYDAADRLVAETHREKASGIHNRTRFSYDKAGNLVEITDNQGRRTAIEYDLLNREIRRIEKDGGITRSFYNGNGQLSKVVRPNQYDPQTDGGAGYQYTYDHRGRVLTVIGPDGQVLQTNTYDADGRLLQQLDGLQSGAAFRYDLAGNRVNIQTSGGAAQELEYDARGNIVGVVDGCQNRTAYQLDSWGRITGIVKADGSTEHYSYDCAGNMVSSTDGQGHTTRYEYGRAGKLTAIQDPNGQRELYGYDAGGRLIRRTDRNGVTLEFGYNLYNALLFKKVKGGALGDFYEYTPEGLLKYAVSAGMRYTYEYDALDRMIRKSASGRTLLALAYDGNGNKVRQTDAAGTVTKFVYSPLDLLTEVWDDGHKLAAYTYNAGGAVQREVHGPIERQFQYDLDQNLTGLLVRSCGELLAENQYLYDGNGNRTRKRQLGGDTLYHYDALNQLKKVEYPSYTEELFYDKAGNRIRRLAHGVEELYQYDLRNRLTAYTKGGVTTTFQYDRAGNLLADDHARYSYDAFNRAERVETFDGHIQLNRYDAEGLRYEMEENGNLVRFIFNQNREVVSEEDARGLNLLIRGTELIASRSNADCARTYYHYASDEMGSITHMVDEAGAVRNRYEYDAWGNITAQEETVPNRFKFTGQQLDPVTQQYYLRARFYNPVIARFTQEDTYRGDGLNLYAYCANNPVYYTDPTGRLSQCVKDAYAKLAKEQGIDLEHADFDTKQRLMAEAVNTVKEKKKNQGNSYENEPIPLPPPADNQPKKPVAEEPTSTKKTSLDYKNAMVEKGGQYYTDKKTIDEIGNLEAKGVDFSSLTKTLTSSRPSTEGGTSNVYKYSDSHGTKFIIHEVTDASGNILHRDFDGVRIPSGQMVNKGGT